ncbi:MAG: DsbA family protein [Blastocatellia bacterium]
MKIIRLLAILGLLALTFSYPVLAQAVEKKQAIKQRQEVEAIIRDYLLKNPSIIKEALHALEVQEAEAAAEATRKAISENREALFRDSMGTTIGNPKGDVIVVVFIDYQCGYCKRMEAILQTLIEQDPGVRVVLKDFPILGPESLLAARVALAARTKGRYAEFFHAFLAAEELNAKSIDAIAARLGWPDATSAAAGSKEIDELIEANHALGNRLSLSGTPAIVIGDRLLPGAVNVETLMMMVAAERVKMSVQ